ncbi:MAG: CotH kinase family protein [Fibrobacterales bacterium]
MRWVVCGMYVHRLIFLIGVIGFLYGCSDSAASPESNESSHAYAQDDMSSNETEQSVETTYSQDQRDAENREPSSEQKQRNEYSAEGTSRRCYSENISIEGILRSENCERELLSGEALLSTEDWRDSTRFIYHHEYLHTYELLIEPEDLSYLDEEPKREEYVPAALVFRGDTIDNILVRYKGSKGAWSPCGEKTKICNLSMKVKFNTDSHPDRLFYGLKKLQFHSMSHSQSRLSERFAYWAYREMGVAASRAVHAKLMINGELEGLFLVVEQIDGRFTRYHLNDDEGNVYKHYWPLDDDLMTTDALLNEFLKTNEEEADHSVVRAFESDLETAGTQENTLAEFLERWGMRDFIARQVVTATTVFDWDGPYLGAWDSGHNTYWAVLPKTERIIMIPWDVDMPEYVDFMRGLATKGILWTDGGGYPGCPDETTARFTKAWFCFQEEYVAAFVDIEERVVSRRHEVLTRWIEQIRPVMEEIAETFPIGTDVIWPDQGGYPYKAHTIPMWKNAIDNYQDILDQRERDLEKMKRSIDLNEILHGLLVDQNDNAP